MIDECVFPALIDHWAGLADALCAFDAAAAWASAFSFWVEEEFGIHVVAATECLPVPEVYESSGYILYAGDH